ncbi:reactive intermediate/imine deaminase [Candidatus Pacearchaeota archaeon CG10_big_fil_rev_8_21_14_0_10_31_24]|nr:MAG: reactive intermediate/imine deaminase [Candidatus Pacearchaeota archaeon CG10_big_fil_rev_8_21_14_0_10_31_24]
MKKTITSENTPKAQGLLSQAILYDSKYTLELSGQIGINPREGKLVDGGIETETKQTLKNIGALLSEVGWDFKNIVKVRIFLADMKDYSVVNNIYMKYFTEKLPTRIALAVKELPLGALVEIECVAVGDEVVGS